MKVTLTEATGEKLTASLRHQESPAPWWNADLTTVTSTKRPLIRAKVSCIVSAAITKCHGLTGWITRLAFLTLLEAEVQQRADPLADKNTLPGTQTAASCHLPALAWPLPVYTHKAIQVRGNPLSCSFYKETSLGCLTSYKTNPAILVASFDLTSQSPTANAHQSLGTLHINFGRTQFGP